MEALQWNEVLATGIKKIDKQHRRLLDIVNQLGAAIERGERGAADAALKEVVDYTVYHFSYEENLLERAGYDMLPLHKRVHELFVRRVSQFQQRHAAGENVLQELHAMLARWLVHHIQNDDRGYAPAVRQYLRQEALNNPERYSNTQPSVLTETPPPAEGKGKKRTKLSLWERLSGYVHDDRG